ncbi:MAG: hypothetical protein ACLQME_04785 [Alphaproteobacteria bacterium]
MTQADHPSVIARFAALLGIAANEIAAADIKNADDWRVCGRAVKPGQEGIRIVTFRSPQADKVWPGTWRRPRAVMLYHLSQTIEIV